jgi:hypothetical protein
VVYQSSYRREARGENTQKKRGSVWVEIAAKEQKKRKEKKKKADWQEISGSMVCVGRIRIRNAFLEDYLVYIF